MPSLTLEFKKKLDAPTVLTFVRGDGSRTSSAIGPHEGYGPVHDLTHYVVESVFGFARAFLGLCAEGWTIQDFDKDALERMPPEAAVAEVLAGRVSAMEMMDRYDSLEEVNWTITQASAGWKAGDRTKAWGEMGAFIERWRGGEAPVEMTAEQYDAVRRALRRLRAEWNEIPFGGTMRLVFEPGRVRRVSPQGELV
ncbi:MAG TPA: hypothetical protein VHE78_16190 [Gemmatimonadaceae bacterium]|nr:hypothetical protein [Gemmatimonadaceae bacterium]